MFKVNVNGNDWHIVCLSRSNRSGFVHEAKLYRGHCLISETKCQYYNRTWERYHFESVISALLHNYNESLIQKSKNEAKRACGVSNMRAKSTRDFANFILSSSMERATLGNFEPNHGFSTTDIEGLRALELLTHEKNEYNGW